MGEDQSMNEEYIFALMMDALDDELDEHGSAELSAYLAMHPALAQEWEAMLFVDALLRQTPPAPAPANLAARTLARLPNPRHRRIFLAVFYVALLIGGMVPVAGFIWLYAQFGSINIFSILGQSAGELWNLVQVFATAMYSTAVTVVTEQPLVLGWLFLLVGVVGIWMTVYQQLANQPRLLSSPLMQRASR
jgi:anti-sigma factor RsiW